MKRGRKLREVEKDSTKKVKLKDDKYTIFNTNNTIDLDRLKEEKCVGSGGFSSVCAGTYQPDIDGPVYDVAIKKIKLKEIDSRLHYFEKEYKNLNTINQNMQCHKMPKELREKLEDFICYYDALSLPNEGVYKLVLQLLNGMDLEKYAKHYDHISLDFEAVFGRLVKGLYLLHNEADFAHLDIKPPNIFLSIEQIYEEDTRFGFNQEKYKLVPKFIDFGVGCYKSQCHHTIAGTPSYFPPEHQSQIFDTTISNWEYSKARDIYALAKTFVYVLLGPSVAEECFAIESAESKSTEDMIAEVKSCIEEYADEDMDEDIYDALEKFVLPLISVAPERINAFNELHESISKDESIPKQITLFSGSDLFEALLSQTSVDVLERESKRLQQSDPEVEKTQEA